MERDSRGPRPALGSGAPPASTHEFEDAPGGTRVNDRVEYTLPLGPLDSLAHELFVGRQLGGIFDYRQRILREIFR